jgi:hypothetical protein
MLHRLLLLLGLSLFLSTLTQSVFAEPTDVEKTRARELLDEGDALVEKNDLAQALGKYEAAHAIMGVPTTGIEVARTLSRLGRLVAARQVADQIVAMPRRATDPTPFVEARDEASRLSKQLSGRIPSLAVVFEGLPEGQEPQLLIDGAEVAEPRSTTPRDVDPGKHRVEGRAGGQIRTSDVELGEGAAETVTLRFQVSQSENAGSSGAGPGLGKKAKAGNGKRTAGWVVGGIGIAGLAVAGVTGAIILSRDGKIDDNCPDKRCNDEGFDQVESNRSLLVVNAIAWGVGIVGTGVGAYLILSSKPESETTATATPLPGGGALSFRRRF